MKELIITILLGCLFWFGAAVVNLENERYAMAIGMCITEQRTADLLCLEDVETRTSFLWHLAYGLEIL